MRRKFMLVTIIFILVSSFMNGASAERPKIGLVLSGGGAKGFAHIGTLKMLDSLKIPIDYIAGTSMGGIVGALYAIGYSGLDIEKIIRRTEWDQVFSDQPPRAVKPYAEKKNDGLYQISFGMKGFTPVAPSGLISGQNISLLLSQLTLSAEYIRNFDDFAIPFRCVAADLITGNEVILKDGSLARALRSTMSIPTVFSPVEYGDSLLVDGGIINNLPADVVKKMGADIVIAVNVSEYRKSRIELKTGLDILDQATNVPVLERIDRNMRMCDLLIAPDIKGYSSADFDPPEVNQLIRIGERAAANAKSDLIRLKEQYGLRRSEDEFVSESATKPIIHGVSITGNTSLTFLYLYDLFGIKPGDVFNAEKFKEKMADLRTSGRFEALTYQVRPVDSSSVRIIVSLKERRKPLIHGIIIDGNESLSFQFLYKFLGLKPKLELDIDLLNQRINELYALGYFATVTYEIEPVAENCVRLLIHINEKLLRRLSIGFHYDDFYKLVGNVGLLRSDTFIPGLRGELLIQFGGLSRLQYQLSYPSRRLDLPIYPYIRLHYKDISVRIYEEQGRRIATYHDRSTSAALGIALQLDKSVTAEAEYHAEFLDIDPDIAMPDPTLFPSWKDRLKMIKACFNLDLLDDVILPRQGFQLKVFYEGSMKDLYSDINYTRFNASYDHYLTLHKKQTFRLNAFYCWTNDSIPIYKYFYLGGPETFVGLDYHQLFGSNFFTGRLEYRYEYKKDIFLKAIANIAKNGNEGSGAGPQAMAKYLIGYGLGVQFLSIIGPLEFIYARGNRSSYDQSRMRNIFYFQAGYRL